MKLKYIFLAIISLTFCLYGCVESQKVVIAKSGIHYVKPQTSKDVIQGEKVKYQLWYDKDKWDIIYKGHPWYEEIEGMMKNKRVINARAIVHKSQELFCFVKEERIPSPFKTISTVVHSQMNIINEEIRKVNGQDVLYIKGYAKRDDPPGTSNMIVLNYYLTNKSGTVTVSVSTGKNLISDYESEIFSLLNGLIDLSLEKQTDDDIESKLIKLKNMQDKGLITQEDYDKSKGKLLNKYGLKSTTHSDVRVLPVRSGVSSQLQKATTYPINGKWKISASEKNNQYTEAKYKDPLFFIFTDNTFDLVGDNESFLDLMKMPKTYYTIRNQKIVLNNQNNEKLMADIEFLKPDLIKLTNIKQNSRQVRILILSVWGALTGNGVLQYLDSQPDKVSELTKDLAIYLSRVR